MNIAGIGALILGGVAVVSAAGAEIRWELRTFRVKRYRFVTEKTAGLEKNLKIVFLSDLHNKVYGKNNDILFRAVKQEKPDLILVGGDMLVGKGEGPYRQGLDFVKRLPALCPVYYADGNHEQRMKENPERYLYSYAVYRDALREAGVIFLENESRFVSLGGIKFCISGLELPMPTYKKFRRCRITAKDVADCLGDAESEEEDFRIMLAHNPAYGDAYLEWGADLVLCGHLHGGIIRIPGLGAVITPQFHLFPKYSGEMTVKGEQALIVSRGLGTHTVNLRLFNQAEVVSVALEKGL